MTDNALDCNLANVLHSLALPAEIEHWPLTRLCAKLVKIGAAQPRLPIRVDVPYAESWPRLI